VAWISGDHRITQIERGGADQEILERDLDALALLFGVDSPGQKGDLLGKRVNRNIGQQFLDERLAAGADRRRGGRWIPCTNSTRATAESAVSWLPVMANNCPRNCATVRPLRSAAIRTLESKISPIASHPMAPAGC
jgi:hypothetical protein